MACLYPRTWTQARCIYGQCSVNGHGMHELTKTAIGIQAGRSVGSGHGHWMQEGKGQLPLLGASSCSAAMTQHSQWKGPPESR